MQARHRYSVVNYRERVLRTRPIAYWQLGEGTGTTIKEETGNGFTGVYSGVTWDGTKTLQGTQGASFVPASSPYANVYGSAFDTAFNQDEGCILLWFKASASGVWTDATTRYLVSFISNAATDYFVINRTVSNNTIIFGRVANSAAKSVTSATFSGTDWQSVMMSWSKSRDQFKAYQNGAQLGTTQTTLASASDTVLESANTVFGAASTFGNSAWSGYIGHCVVWNTPEDQSKIALMTNFV